MCPRRCPCSRCCRCSRCARCSLEVPLSWQGTPDTRLMWHRQSLSRCAIGQALRLIAYVHVTLYMHVQISSISSVLCVYCNEGVSVFVGITTIIICPAYSQLHSAPSLSLHVHVTSHMHVQISSISSMLCVSMHSVHALCMCFYAAKCQNAAAIGCFVSVCIKSTDES